MTKHLPYLSEEYGLMPWHFGGEERLTDYEIDAYLAHYRDKKQREQAEVKKARQRTPSRRSSSRR